MNASDPQAHRPSPRSSHVRLLTLAVGTALICLVPTAAQAYTIRSSDTLSEIAERTGISTARLAAANGIDDADRIYQGRTLDIPGTSGGGSGGSHTVAPGETLSQIAGRYGVSTRALAAANGISDPDSVRSGSTLSVSGSTGSSQVAAAPAQPSGSSSARQLITAAANRHGWDPAIPLGLAMQESGWNNGVVSSAGARGIMQVMPATGDWIARELLERPLDLSDPVDNTAAGVAYLDHLYNRFDRDLVSTLAAYYEGQGNVRRDGPSEAGRRYAANVMALADRYR